MMGILSEQTGAQSVRLIKDSSVVRMGMVNLFVKRIPAEMEFTNRALEKYVMMATISMMMDAAMSADIIMGSNA